MVNDWSIALRNCHTVDVVYFDISKAFNTATQQPTGFEGDILSFISDFVVGRSQRVVLPNGVSSWRRLGSGVPQGIVYYYFFSI